MTATAKSPKLSQTMEEALVYLGRGAYRAHLEPEKRTLLALERRGMIRWSTNAELGALGEYRVHDTTLLWTVTLDGWAFLKAAYGMDRPADAGRLTVEEALDSVEDRTARTVTDRRMHNASDRIMCDIAYTGSGNRHLELRCEDCDVLRMSRLTLGSLEDQYHTGRVTQDDYEAYTYVFSTLSGLHANPTVPSFPAVRRIARKLLAVRPELGSIPELGITSVEAV
jgi:hypothetical protein